MMGVPLVLTLGLITGIMEMIPYLGAWVSAVPAALIALQALGPWYCGMVLLLFLALHIFEGYLIAPLVQRRAMHLPPALTLVAQVLLGQLMGALGLLIAAPLTVTVVVLVKKLYVEYALGDKTAEAPSKRKAALRDHGRAQQPNSWPVLQPLASLLDLVTSRVRDLRETDGEDLS